VPYSFLQSSWTRETGPATERPAYVWSNRYEICFNDLGREIAVTGSVARGVADEYSDVELNLWVDVLPAAEGWRAWLEGMGVTDLGENIVETLELARDEGFDVTAALRSMQDGLRAGLKAAAGPST